MKCRETFPTCLNQIGAKIYLRLMCVCCAPVSVETWQVAPGRGMTFIFYIKNQQDNPAPEINICRPRSQDLFWSQDLYFLYKKPAG